MYFHTLYQNYNERVYHGSAQVAGKIKHESIDKSKYSTEKRYIQGMAVYSEKYRLMGKIDIYDIKTKTLIERKNKIVKIYDGYKLQLVAQKVCLEEMGYEVKNIEMYSITDNKVWKLKYSEDDLKKMEDVIKQIRNFDFKKINVEINPEKCNNCIYNSLCNFKTI
ncbi:MAG: type V CRISPR-associated protein Cas4 [Candidatus Magasanikbacteria bacterium CG1_02_32_51]|uniref:Type V CRISPR-associated protein Cas4 n=1 Tax=Candidatus Magasanikbacteria bacterium CG1_02_32_51 TaxID=1805238 RepID=A0A1J4U5U2_9BACT|nr:MAG: type V CRISPR-associated protein Cas4 [Candidatus Magasanikbacteria bacterium CG1_02_32_51]